METTGNQHLRDIFKTVLGDDKTQRRQPAPPPNIYVKGDRNVILLSGTVHLAKDHWEPPQQ